MSVPADNFGAIYEGATPSSAAQPNNAPDNFGAVYEGGNQNGNSHWWDSPVGYVNAAGNAFSKGLAQTGIGALGLINKVGSYFDEPGTQTPVSASAPNALSNMVNNFGADTAQTHPWTSAIFNAFGQGAPFVAMPTIKGAQFAGQYIPKIAELLQGGLGRFGGEVANQGLTGGAIGALAGPISNPNADFSQTIPSGIEGGALGGAATGTLGTLAGKAGRLINVATANAKDLQGLSGQSYDNIRDVADANNFKTNPVKFSAALQNLKNTIDTSGTLDINQNLKNPINNAYSSLEADKLKPNAFTVQGTHGQIRGIGDMIGDLLSKGKTDFARQLYPLKDSLQEDMVDSLRNQGMGAQADQFMQEQSNYAKNVVPLLSNPTSAGKIAKQGTLIAAISHLPLPQVAKTAAGVGLGLHDTSPIANALKRYTSTYSGGPESTIGKFGNVNPFISQQLAAMNANSQ